MVVDKPILGHRSKSFLLALAIQVTGAGLAFLCQIVLARVLGASSFGQVSAVVSVSTIAGLAMTLGLGGLALRYLPQERNPFTRRAYVGFAYRATSCVSIIFAAVGAVAATWLFGLSPQVAAATAFLSVFTALSNLGSDVGRAIEKFPLTYGAAVVLRPLVTIAIVATIGLKVGSTGSATDGVLALGVGALLAVVVQAGVIGRATSVPMKVRHTYEQARSWLLESPHYLLANGLVLILLQTDLLVSSLFLSSSELGYYAAAIKSVGVLSIVAGAINTVAVPRFARNVADLHALGREAQSATSWQLGLTLLVGIPIFCLAPMVLGFFGPEFADAAWALRVMVAAQLVNVALGPGGTLLVYTGHPRIATFGCLACIVVSAGSTALGASMFGLTGASIGYAAGAVFGGGIMWALARKHVGVGGSAVGALARRVRDLRQTEG